MVGYAMGLLNTPKLARNERQGLMSPLEIQIDTMVNDPLRTNLSSRLTQQDLVNKGLLAIGMSPMGITKAKTAYELAHEVAQKNATKMLGLPKNNTAMDRAKAMGYDIDFQHGSANPDITAFDLAKTQKSDPGYLGQAIYGAKLGTKAYANGGVVYPLMAKTGKMQKITPQNWNIDSPYSEIGDAFAKVGGNTEAKNKISQEFTRKKLKSGIQGIVDTSSGQGLDQIAVFDPSLIRSRFAAFDPARAAENDLLAGLAPYIGIGGLLGLGYYGGENETY